MIKVNKIEPSSGAKIKVIGLGGGGTNAINTMIESGLKFVELISANTDRQALINNKSFNKIQLGKMLTKGLGAGGNPKIGKEAAREDYEIIKNSLKGADMVFIVAGMGGGTGTGAAPVVAEITRELGILSVGVVTKPFLHEKERKAKIAEDGITELKKYIDTLIVVANDKIFDSLDPNIDITESFMAVDKILLKGIDGITGIVNSLGYINIDFADIRSIMKNKGLAIMGMGSARGENAALDAVKEALNSPLYDDISIDGATGLVVNITSSSSLPFREYQNAINYVSSLVSKDAEVKGGLVFNPDMNDKVNATIIATGFKKEHPTTIVGVLRPIEAETIIPRSYLENSEDDLETPSILREKNKR